MASNTGWKQRVLETAWRAISSPFTIGVYMAVAIWIAFLASAKTGIPAYIFMAAAFLLVIFVDPPERLARFRERRRRSSPLSSAAQRRSDAVTVRGGEHR
ncbi:hypothetical protein NXT3_PC00401 (plasmid) [Sinorhizobium fredii]|uniref:Transmembrane protein n=1 Tax=Rhizobium fredii TaxID=380 RepID=A0A2L0HDL7_RHIFR|nr:hypothetical protein NXT3_PC00401 [Sinorhizobium fredii]